MKNIYGTLLAFFLIGNPAFAQIEYIKNSDHFQSSSAIMTTHGILALGATGYMLFNDETSRAKFSGPHKIDGYPLILKPDPSGKIIYAGLNHSGSYFPDTDTRQAILGYLNLSDKGTVQSVEKIHVKGKLPYALDVFPSSEIISLSDLGGKYRLSYARAGFFDSSSQEFGSGQIADMLITASGRIAVLGFDEENSEHLVEATFWEFDKKFKLVNKTPLGRFKKRGQMSALMTILEHGQDLYLIYGWDEPGTKDERPDEVSIQKIRGTTEWKNIGTAPYQPGAKAFISLTGNPYILYPRVDELEKLEFSAAHGKKSKMGLKRPTEPTRCFPKDWRYEIVDVLKDGTAEYLVLNGDPLNHPVAGCTSIAKITN
ncbi:MAG: hypothetical protein JKY71_03945 [Alphaproteobacteria bacterium]|nr:hypothetical protein [Alphaproteobacteria bacterium]